MDTIIMLRGGHTTLVKECAPAQLQRELDEFRQSHFGKGTPLFYVQSEQYGDNGLAINPIAVVALVASP